MSQKLSLEFSQKIKLAFLFFSFFVGLGVNFLQAQEIENQQTINEKKMTLRQKQASIALKLADSFLEEERFDKAFSEYQLFVEMYPHEPMRFYALDKMAKIEEKRQNFYEALTLYQQLHKENVLNEKGVEYLFEAARLHERIGEYQQAQETYQKVIDYYPDSFYAENAKNRLVLRDMLSFEE